MVERRKRRRPKLGGTLRRLKMGAANAAEMIRLGRLTTPHRTRFDVVHQDRVYGLRRYHAIERVEGEGLQAPLLLITRSTMCVARSGSHAASALSTSGAASAASCCARRKLWVPRA